MHIIRKSLHKVKVYFSQHPMHLMYMLVTMGTAFFLPLRIVGFTATSLGIAVVLTLSSFAVYPIMRSLCLEYTK